MICGDNQQSVHKMQFLDSPEEVIIAYCEKCKKRFYFPAKDHVTYRKLFKRDILQPGNNLYYKEYGKMNVI